MTFSGQDLTRHSLPETAYDFVLCNHVLEHIEDDDAAVAGLRRLPRAGGIVVLTVAGNFSRRETLRFPDNSLNGHWRDYGMDVVHLLSRHFAKAEPKDLNAYNRSADGLNHGINQHDAAFILAEPRRYPAV